MRQVEALLRSANPFGFYQKTRLFLIFIIMGILVANAQVLTTLFTFTPGHRCSLPQESSSNATIGLLQFIPQERYHGELGLARCKMYTDPLANQIAANSSTNQIAANETSNSTQSCQYGIVYSDSLGKTIVTEFDLVCDRAVLKSVILGTHLLFLQLGLIFYGFISDKFGRKKALFLTCAIWSISTCIAVFVDNFRVFVVFWLLASFSGGAVYIIPNVLSNEMVTTEHRPFVNGILEVGASICSAALAVLYYWIGDWRLAGKIFAFTGVAATGLILLLDESPRWLMTAGKTREALDIIRKIGKINGVDTTTSEMRIALDHSKSFVGMVDEHMEQTGLLQTILKLVTKKHLRRKFGIMIVVYFSQASVLFGVPMGLQVIKLNPYLLFAVQMIISIIPTLLAPTVVKYTGRTMAMFLFTLLCGLTCAMAGAPPASMAVVSAVFAVLARSLVSGAFVIYYLLGSEILPTEMRSSAHSAVRAACSLPAAGVPFLYIYLGDDLNLPWLGFAIIGCLTTLGAFLILFFPETQGAPLTDTVGESERQLPVIWGNFRTNIRCGVVAEGQEDKENLRTLVSFE